MPSEPSAELTLLGSRRRNAYQRWILTVPFSSPERRVATRIVALVSRRQSVVLDLLRAFHGFVP